MTVDIRPQTTGKPGLCPSWSGTAFWVPTGAATALKMELHFLRATAPVTNRLRLLHGEAAEHPEPGFS